MGRNLQIVGTHVLYAHEARAGVFLERGLLVTRDMDVLWDTRPKLGLCAIDDVDSKGLIAILKKADHSFDLLSKKRFRAVNKDGCMVDLIQSKPESLLIQEG